LKPRRIGIVPIIGEAGEVGFSTGGVQKDARLQLLEEGRPRAYFPA
jgi:hypothetical protein